MTRRQQIVYGLLGFSKDLLAAIAGGHLLLYLTDGLLISAIAAGTILFAGRIVDATSDLVLAYLLDRFPKQIKRMYLVGILTYIVLSMWIFSLGQISSQAPSFSLLAVSYIFLSISYTLMDLSYWAMLPKLAQDSTSEKNLSSLATVFSSTAALIGFSTVLPLVHFLGGEDITLGFSRIIYMMTGLTAFLLLLAYPQLSIPSRKSQQPSRSPLSQLRAIAKNRLFWSYIAYFFLFQLSFEWMNAYNIYYFKYGLSNEAFYSLYAITILAQMAGAALYPKLHQFFSSAQLFVLGASLSIVGMTGLWLLGRFAPQGMVGLSLFAVVKQIGSGLYMVGATADLAFVTRTSQQKTEGDQTAGLTALKLLTAKATSAIAGLGVGASLTWIGYQHSKPLLDTTTQAMGYTALGIPILLVVFATVAYAHYVSVQIKPS